MSDHYAEAERLLVAWQDSVNELTGDTDEDLLAEVAKGSALATQTLSAAGIHAMLAAIDDNRQPREITAPAPAPGTLTIPWPPDDATVARAADVLYRRSLRDYKDLHGCAAVARAVLDALGAGDE